jgi:hypothetical protein
MTESELDQILLDRLQRFLLEIGCEWCFVAQHPRGVASEAGECLDLLFFHRKLRCLVAVDVKFDDFLTEYTQQMHSYLIHLARYVAHEDENVPIGILLCAGRETEVVRFVMPSDDPGLVSRCQLELPRANHLRQWLQEQRELLMRPAALQCGKPGDRNLAREVLVAPGTRLR